MASLTPKAPGFGNSPGNLDLLSGEQPSTRKVLHAEGKADMSHLEDGLL